MPQRSRVLKLSFEAPVKCAKNQVKYTITRTETSKPKCYNCKEDHTAVLGKFSRQTDKQNIGTENNEGTKNPRRRKYE